MLTKIYKNFLKNLKNLIKIKQENTPYLQSLKANLRPYQREGFEWLCFLKDRGLGGILADDMGLGKTIQVIALLTREKAKQAKIPSLLVVPASLLGNWQSEITKFAPKLQCKILHPSFTQKIHNSEDSFDNHEIILTSYKMACKISWLFDKTWNVLIIDEAQSIKTPEAGLTREIKSLRPI